jgi:hypothetical protein
MLMQVVHLFLSHTLLQRGSYQGLFVLMFSSSGVAQLWVFIAYSFNFSCLQIWWRHEFCQSCTWKWHTCKYSFPFYLCSWCMNIQSNLDFLDLFILIQVLAFEAGRKNRIRVNTISAGNSPLNFLSISHLFQQSLTILLKPMPLVYLWSLGCCTTAHGLTSTNQF